MPQSKKHKKKALIEATIVMILLIILMFISGMTYLDPPPETGIAVNFGTSDVGSGVVQPQHNTPQPKPVQQQPEQQPETQPEVKDDVLTQDTEEAPVIKEKPNKPKPKPTPKPVKPKPKPKPTPDKNISDILNNVNNAPGSNTNNASGEGNDNQAGDKGDTSGDVNASGYYGTGGSGGGGTGNYRLGNRQALSKPTPQFSCNEGGRVVVKIYVSRNGKVLSARAVPRIPGSVRSNTNAPCLTKAAVQAAKQTKWNKDNKAPERQYGYIIYNFKVTE